MRLPEDGVPVAPLEVRFASSVAEAEAMAAQEREAMAAQEQEAMSKEEEEARPGAGGGVPKPVAPKVAGAASGIHSVLFLATGDPAFALARAQADLLAAF